jgi:hypothetical protein
LALCERCGEEIAAANELDRAGDVDRQRRVVIIAGKPRRLIPEHWQVFTLLYGLRGNVVYSDRIHAELYYGLPEPPRSKIIVEHVSRLQNVLGRSRYRIFSHRGSGYELIITAGTHPGHKLTAAFYKLLINLASPRGFEPLLPL